LAAVKTDSQSSTSTSSVRKLYQRSSEVKAYVLMRAAGKCESCHADAPFLRKDGTPYLEPHHINRLSDGGLDHPRYVGAICPACHREIHYGLNGNAKNEALREYVGLLEKQIE
jgi:5-methylcytosine-specific restriction protein A